MYAIVTITDYIVYYCLFVNKCNFFYINTIISSFLVSKAYDHAHIVVNISGKKAEQWEKA